MRLKGFILTIDAILALGLAMTALAATAALTQDYNPPYAGIAILGHDLLRQTSPSFGAVNFTALTGLQFHQTPPNANRLSVHIVAYNYTWNCHGLVTTDCFSNYDFTSSNSRSEGWVTE